MPGKRLFVALDLPEVVRETLAALSPELPGVRRLRPAQIHLTLSFLGAVIPDHETILLEKLAAIRLPRFFLPLRGVGTFPAKGRPRVVWVGLGTGHPQLYHLHKRVQDAALAAGLEPDLRPWHPHISIARCKDVNPHALRPFLKKHEAFDAGLIPIESFVLYSSRPGPAGSVYTPELAVRAR